MKEKDLDRQIWKSGRHDPQRRHDPELCLSMAAAQRFRHVCKYCMEHKRTCSVCAGVI